jgi:short-subunit dehydrogenase
MKLSSQQAHRIKNQYGPWALVTGSSSGIGLALATALAEAGLNVILHGRRAAELQRISSRLQESTHVQVETVSSDLSTEEGIQEVLLLSSDKPIGLFVACAGFGTSGFFHEGMIEHEINMLRVNAEALMVMTHHFSKRFIRQKRGGIILLSSLVGFQGVPYAAHYAATKAYVQSFGEALAVELKPFGVDVLTAAPGPVASGFGKRANLKMDMALAPQQVVVPILSALGRKDTVLPGWLTKLLVYSLRTVPRWGKVRIMQKVMGGMTRHQRSGNVLSNEQPG